MVLTGADGIISAVSPSLEAMTGRSRTEAIGSPLALLLHSGQPSGLNTNLMPALQAGEMTVAYQHLADNLGGSVWLLTVSVGISEGTLLVGFPPSHEKAQRTAERLYRLTTDVERSALEAGQSREAATALGAEKLDAQLADMGNGSYAEWIQSVLQAEVDDRPTLAGSPQGGPMDYVWDRALDLHTIVAKQQAGQTKLFEASQVMASAAQSAENQAEPMDQTGAQVVAAASQHQGGSATLLTAGHRVSAGAQDSALRVRALQQVVERTQTLMAAQRFMLAGTLVLTEAVFAALRPACLASGASGRVLPDAAYPPAVKTRPGDRELEFVAPLVAALRELAPRLSMGTARIQAGLNRITKEAIEAAGQLRTFDSSLASWRLLSQRFGLPTWLVPDDLDPQGAAARLDGLVDLARAALGRGGFTDPTPISEAAAQVSRALRQVAGPFRRG